MKKGIYAMCILVTLWIPSFWKMEMNATTEENTDVVPAESIQFLVDGEEIKERYNKAVVLQIEIAKERYHEGIEVVLFQGTSEEGKIQKELVWTLEKDSYVTECNINLEGEAYYVQVRDSLVEDLILATSTTFSIDTTKPVLQLLLEDEDITIHKGDLFFRSAKHMEVIVSDILLEEALCTLQINGEKVPVEWNREEDTYRTVLLFDKEGIFDILYHVEDKAGNVLEQSTPFRLLFDFTAPLVDIRGNQQLITEQFSTMYTDNLVLDFTVTEMQLNVERSYILINGKQERLIWKKDGKYHAQRTLHDGSYQITYHIEDMAGHSSEKSFEKEFYVDSISPRIEVDSNAVEVQNKDVGMNIQIIDQHVKDREIVYTVNQQVRKLEPEWSKQAGSYSTYLLFQEEGVHEVTIHASDEVGHRTLSNTYSFTIDKTAPTLQIEMNHIQAKEHVPYITNNDVELLIKIQDSHMKTRNIELFKNGQIVRQQDEGNQSTWMVKAETNQNDDYDVRVRASDQAGNESISTISFAIHTNIAPVVIDNDIFHGLAVAQSWIPKVKGESETYRVLDCTLQRNRKKVPYIWGTAIEQEGDYALDIVVIDDAMNIALLSSTFYFTIDKTAPVIDLLMLDTMSPVSSEIAEGQELQLKIQQYDSEKRKAEKFTSIIVNGEEIPNLDIMNKEKEFLYQPLEKGSYVIQASAKDEAGNMTEKMWDFHVVDHPKVTKKKTPIPPSTQQVEETGKKVWYALPVCIGIILVGTFYYGRKRT